MQMIDVMKRLAELDSKNPNVVKESTAIEECGMMPMPGMGGQHTPASINMTADSGSELTGMLRDIMQLAGMQKVGAEHLGIEPEPMKLTPEPIAAVGPAIAEPMSSAADDMRSVIDKLHSDDEEGDDLGAFQGDDEEGDADDEEETDEGQYDNSPADPNNVPAADADEYAHHENQPGSGNTSNGEKRQSNLPTATFESLMKEYKSFIGESSEEEMDEAEEDEEELEEGTCSACHKDPCACDDEKVDESTADILKLAGLK
jgi:hypothetical protein